MCNASRVSVPILGIIFLSKVLTAINKLANGVCFRPHTGDYFFIKVHTGKDIDFKKDNVSVPILGIIFLSGYNMNTIIKCLI